MDNNMLPKNVQNSYTGFPNPRRRLRVQSALSLLHSKLAQLTLAPQQRVPQPGCMVVDQFWTRAITCYLVIQYILECFFQLITTTVFKAENWLIDHKRHPVLDLSILIYFTKSHKKDTAVQGWIIKILKGIQLQLRHHLEQKQIPDKEEVS